MKIYFKIVSLLIILGIIFPFLSYSQNNDEVNKKDSIILKSGNYVYINCKLTFIENDTIIFPGDSLEVSYSKKRKHNPDQFYNDLKNNTNYKPITNKIFDFLFTYPSTKSNNNNGHSIEKQFKPYTGKTINSIEIKRLDVFGPSINDTSRLPSTWLSSKANDFHIKTQNRIIENNLLIEVGEKIDPFQVADNERILRKLPYIKDSKIILSLNKEDTSKVDITVITQDVWSKGIEGNLSSINSGYFEIFDKNILGTGHYQSNLIEFNDNTKPPIGYEGYYSFPNINGSFINATAFYIHNNNRERYGFKVGRDFISPDIKYAGSYNLARELWYEGYISDTNLNVTPENHIIEEVWFGRSFKMKEDINRLYRKNITITTKLVSDGYQFKEENSYDTTLKYLDNKQAYLSLSFSKSRFYKGSLISSFGKTEDIPTGHLLQLTLGYHYDEVSSRMCSGINYSFAKYKPSAGYFYSNIFFGTFFNSKYYNQAAFNLDIKYFTKLFKVFNYQSRQFFRVNYTVGYDRRPYERLTLNNGNGIRQFSNNELYGTKRFNATIENILFSPINVYGNKMAFITFLDIGVVGNKNDFIFKNEFYSGLGFGVRIRNDNLIIKSLEIKFIFYPKPPLNHSETFLHLGNVSGFRFENFNANIPDNSAFN